MRVKDYLSMRRIIGSLPQLRFAKFPPHGVSSVSWGASSSRLSQGVSGDSGASLKGDGVKRSIPDFLSSRLFGRRRRRNIQENHSERRKRHWSYGKRIERFTAPISAAAAEDGGVPLWHPGTLSAPRRAVSTAEASHSSRKMAADCRSPFVRSTLRRDCGSGRHRVLCVYAD